MDDAITTAEVVQSKALLQNRGKNFPLAAIGGGDVVVDSRL